MRMLKNPNECRGSRCTKARRPGQLMCRECWFAVPKPLRDEVLATYRPGSTSQSMKYLLAVAHAIASLDPKHDSNT